MTEFLHLLPFFALHDNKQEDLAIVCQNSGGFDTPSLFSFMTQRNPKCYGGAKNYLANSSKQP